MKKPTSRRPDSGLSDLVISIFPEPELHSESRRPTLKVPGSGHPSRSVTSALPTPRLRTSLEVAVLRNDDELTPLPTIAAKICLAAPV